VKSFFFIAILVVLLGLLFGTVRLLSTVLPEVIVKYMLAMGVYAGIGWLATLLLGGTALYGALGGALLGIAFAYNRRLW